MSPTAINNIARRASLGKVMSDSPSLKAIHNLPIILCVTFSDGKYHGITS